jgi:hypothetical protein
VNKTDISFIERKYKMKVKCSSMNCINVKEGYCTLEEIELDRLVCIDKNKETFYDDYCFECLDYSDGKEASVIEKLRKELGYE